MLEDLIQLAKESKLPIEISIKIGCACKNDVLEETPPLNTINTESNESITTENNKDLVQE